MNPVFHLPTTRVLNIALMAWVAVLPGLRLGSCCCAMRAEARVESGVVASDSSRACCAARLDAAPCCSSQACSDDRQRPGSTYVHCDCHCKQWHSSQISVRLATSQEEREREITPFEWMPAWLAASNGPTALSFAKHSVIRAFTSSERCCLLCRWLN